MTEEKNAERGVKMSEKCTGGISNTRPERTRENTLRALIDWVSISFEVETSDWTQIAELLGVDHLDFEYHDYGYDTYQEHIRFSNIVVMRKDDFKYRLNLSGQGCREYETYSRLDWLQLFLILKDFLRGKATRIDLAIDDFGKRFTVDLLRRTFLDDRCVTRLSKMREMREYDTGDLSLTMDSLYFGSLSSRVSINFYDKKLERESKDKEVTVESWTRTELRLKREYADDVIDYLLMPNADVGSVALGILQDKIRFVRSGNDGNKRRRPVLQWWTRFLNDVKPLKLSLKAPDKTIEKSIDWVEHSVAPTIATLKLAMGEDEFKEFLSELIADGESRLNENHRQMIRQYVASGINDYGEMLRQHNDDLAGKSSYAQQVLRQQNKKEHPIFERPNVKR